MNTSAAVNGARETRGATSPAECFHCARPLPHVSHARITVHVDGAQRAVCCEGCAAALEFIDGAGLGDYYRLRERRPQVAQALEALRTRWRHLDREDALAALTRDLSAGTEGATARQHLREVTLELPDMSCAACAWLLESALQRCPGTAAMSDLATHRLRVRFDPAETPLSHVLALTASFGYPATPIAPSADADARARMRRRELIAIGIAGIGAMQVMMLSLARYLDVGAELGALEWRWMAAVEAIVATFVLATAGRGLLRGGWSALRHGRVTVDAPLALGIAAGWVVSMAALTRGGALYFDAVTMLVFLTLGSRYLEARLRRRAVVGLDSPSLALRVHAASDVANGASNAGSKNAGIEVPDAVGEPNGERIGEPNGDPGGEFVPASLLLPGDLAWVRGGEQVPADGVLERGDGSCDESALSGESAPVHKRAGDPLYAGTLNLGQPLLLQVTRPLAASRLQQLQDDAREIGDARALQPAWVDRIGHAYGLVMLAVAFAAALAWWFVAPERAPAILLSVLVIACPCALAVAMPVTIAAANSGLLRRGALITRANVFEHADDIDTVLLDKTGTLTRVQGARCTAVGWRDAQDRLPDTARLRALAATLERHATHPYARLLAAAPTDGVPPATQVDVQREGVSGQVDGQHWRIGTHRFAFAAASASAGPAVTRPALPAPGTAGAWLTCNGAAVARFDFELDVNPGVPQALANLRARGWRLCIASGDSAASVEAVARVLGIPDWHAALTAEDKLAFVRRLQAEGRRVLMVGDGTNDAAALACADIGVAVAPGTALCQTSAGARLLRGDLRLLVDVLDSARHARRIMRSNLVWALGYNALALPLAAFGAIPPLWAAVGMSVSSLAVVLNALRATTPPAATARTPAAVAAPAPFAGARS